VISANASRFGALPLPRPSPSTIIVERRLTSHGRGEPRGDREPLAGPSSSRTSPS
jgi:hypothetical protein